MTPPKDLSRLVETFDRNIEAYKSGHYNEAQVRREFIDPLFKLLGWDIDNEQGLAEAYKDVIHEDAIKVGGAAKAPDYCFRIGGTRKFFLEAKKPSVNLMDDISPAFQLRRYAWSARLPLSILTDFEELAVYDCRVKPVKTDKASTARTIYINYTEYSDRWDEIASIFSREAVLKGFFDKYAESHKAKKGTAGVDEAFLEEVESWRDTLARNIALRNPRLTQRELNFAVQMTIDRIIFLRICEDRGIEDYGRLQKLCDNTQVYRELCKIFREADARYNSGIFHFHKEKDRPTPPDELTLNLKIDEDVLKDIFKGLYYPESPYEFSVLPADILGQVYEQFLGKVIRLISGHRAIVEYKPEVKKAGGVYYTPTYIVDYIVKNTVGKLLEGKKPGPRGGVSKLKILDPACGSGSFLIGAYQYLLDWHRDRYVEDGPKKYRNVLYQGPGGEWRLTTAERKRILLNNIYGVDIDPQAVEVTKLSLLLKVLEGESGETLNRQLKLFHERALPDLGSNIKCGNSLIGPDFFSVPLYKEGAGGVSYLYSEEEQYRINAFDWAAEFPDIMTSGGFDAVIGNPPYGASFLENEKSYFQNNYQVFQDTRDVYACFIEASFKKLKPDGFCSFIVPSAWLGAPKNKLLRMLFLEKHIDTIILLPYDVFADAYVDTTIFVIANKRPNLLQKVRTYAYGKREKLGKIDLSPNDYKFIKKDAWEKTDDKKFTLNPNALQILLGISKKDILSFGDVIRIKRGVLFDEDLLTEKRTTTNSYRYFEGDVYRYQLNLVTNRWVEFSDKMRERPKELIWFEGRRILLRRLVNRRQRLMATSVSGTFITNKNLYSVICNNDKINLFFVLGVLNSRLISYLYLNQVTQATKDDFPQVTIKDILSLPFPDSKDKARHDKMVELVEGMLDSNKRLQTAKAEHDKTVLRRQIDATDNQIDRLVYELYGLTEKEIAIVEESTK